MLIGEYQYTMDPKGRLNIPARLREELGDRFVVTRGLDECLFVYSLKEWEKILIQLMEQPLSGGRNTQRYIASGAVEVEPDKQGRILLPQVLRDHAHLDKEIVVAGVINRAEIWDKSRWDQGPMQVSSDMIAEEMEKLGF